MYSRQATFTFAARIFSWFPIPSWRNDKGGIHEGLGLSYHRTPIPYHAFKHIASLKPKIVDSLPKIVVSHASHLHRGTWGRLGSQEGGQFEDLVLVWFHRHLKTFISGFFVMNEGRKEGRRRMKERRKMEDENSNWVCFLVQTCVRYLALKRLL